MKVRPGHLAPAVLFCAAAAAAGPAWAQQARQPQSAQPPGQGAPTPAAPSAVAIDDLMVAKLVWTSLVALDQANKTGNYSVLRDLGAPSFQTNNSAATLGGIFEALRARQVDLSNTLLVAPTYDFPPGLVQGGLLRARGVFPLRPNGISFDLLFQNISGQWRLFGIAVAPTVAAPTQPAATRR